MKKTFLIIMAFGLLAACSSDDNICEKPAENPLEEYEWLKVIQTNMTDCSFETSILQGTYKNQTVFFTAVTDALYCGINTPCLYNCQGDIIHTFTADDHQGYAKQVTIGKVLYRCKD